MFDNNFKTIKTLLHSFKSKAWTSLAVILFGVLAIPALAQGTPPAASANCTVTAMNRTAPLQGDYGFTIYNIPGASNPFMAVVKEDDLAIMTAWFATLFFKCR